MSSDSAPSELSNALTPLGLPEWRYFQQVTSTNDLALAWAGAGAADGSLVLADAQSAGRGRGERRWVTRPGAALAMSLIFRPTRQEADCLPRFAPLAALGLVWALAKWGLAAQIKWPNDVLLGGSKVAGVLVEADWQGDRLDTLVVGMGVNVSADAVPPAEQVRYPATAVEAELGQAVDRWAVLAEILHGITYYRTVLTGGRFMAEWNDHLAFKGEPTLFRFPDGKVQPAEVVGVESDGRLTLRTAGNETLFALAGEIEWVDRAN